MVAFIIERQACELGILRANPLRASRSPNTVVTLKNGHVTIIVVRPLKSGLTVVLELTT
jgi:hypothetical protein